MCDVPEDYQQVIVMRYQDDLTFEEIGRVMGRSSEAVRKLWTRAMGRLQQEWESPP